MDAEETSWRRRRARARGGQSRSARGGRRGTAAAASVCCLRLAGFLLSSPGLLALLVCYCFLGACLFRFLESGSEEEPREAVEKYREECIRELWHITERLNVLYEKNWTALVNEQLRMFEMSVVSVTVADADGYDSQNIPQRQQSFARALFYSVTIMTTIGFGKFSPKTPTNKVAVMLFAGFGIPITMICLVYIGMLLAHGFQTAYAMILPGISAEILSPLNDKIECKSHPGRLSQSSELADSEEDLRESTEVSYSMEHFSMEHKDKKKQTVKSNSMMLTSLNLTLDDLGQNIAGSVASERHSLLVECEKCAMEHGANYMPMKMSMGSIDGSSDSGNQVNINLVEMRKSVEDSSQKLHEECGIEERSNDEENCHHTKEWSSEHHNTPSRIPLIGKDLIQTPNCLHHTLAETKYLWNTPLPMRPPTPAPAKCPPRRGPCTKYDQDSSPLAGSDRNLCSTPSLAAIPMDLTTVKQSKLPFWLIFGVLIAYICVGAAIFSSLEGWPFLDGAFFCFMLLSTVGFGDFVPGYSQKAWNSIQTSWMGAPESQVTSLNARIPHPWTLTSCFVYLIFGIVLVASSITLIQNKWAPYIHTLRTSLSDHGDDCLEEEEIGEELDNPKYELREPSFNQLFQREHQ